jgi:tRNA/tmRNA/rRNA uracil-C5-methylase (TrmA/RlmC/RlmD family)
MDTGHPSTYSEFLRRVSSREASTPRPAAPGECSSHAGVRCRLCMAGTHLYEREYPLKAAALNEFWSETLPDVPLAALIPSPRGREYRFVSKRKVYREGRHLRLGLIDPDESESGGCISVGRCAIEPPAHALIYEAAGKLLASPEAAGLASVLRYVIVKGDEKEYLVLLNIGAMHPEAVRAAGVFSRQLARRAPDVKSLLLYEDTTGGRYYLGSGRGRAPRVRKVFGRETLLVRARGRSYLFGPLTFSQVNRGMIEPLVQGVREMLEPRPAQTLFDLYCGYGLFALSLADSVRAVVGVESGRDAVEAARGNAARQHVRSARFVQSDISGETIGKLMRDAAPGDAVILDPPRGGTAPGVIEGIAPTSPARVVHIFCNIDGIRGELKRWASRGYAARRAVPYDLFPGTASVEVMVLLTPAA